MTFPVRASTSNECHVPSSPSGAYASPLTTVPSSLTSRKPSQEIRLDLQPEPLATSASNQSPLLRSTMWCSRAKMTCSRSAPKRSCNWRVSASTTYAVPPATTTTESPAGCSKTQSHEVIPRWKLPTQEPLGVSNLTTSPSLCAPCPVSLKGTERGPYGGSPSRTSHVTDFDIESVQLLANQLQAQEGGGP